MATTPLRKCSHPGCKALIREGARCEKHKKQQTKEQDKRRGTAHERGYNYRWQQYSKAYLAQPENALCVECKKHGRVKASECVDHIVSANGDEVLFWDASNHQPLCIACNSRKGNR